jgi:hypothetical protein
LKRRKKGFGTNYRLVKLLREPTRGQERPSSSSRIAMANNFLEEVFNSHGPCLQGS